MGKPETQRTVEEHAECTSWQRYSQADHWARKHLRDGTPMGAMYAKAAADALESYQKARQKRVAAEMEARRLVPVQEWLAFKATVTKLANVMMGIREIAGRANPQAPAIALQAIEEFFENRFNPALSLVDQEGSDIVHSAGLRIVTLAEFERLSAPSVPLIEHAA